MTTENYTSSQKFVGAIRVICSGLIWGLIPVFLRMSDGSTVVKAWSRVAVGAIVMLLYLVVTGRTTHLKALSRKQVFDIGVQGALLGFNWLLFLFALDGMGSIALGELIGYTSPIFIAIFAPAVLKEKFDPRVFISIALALIGLTFILAPGGFALNSETAFRALMGLGSAIVVSVLTIRGKRVIKGVPSDIYLFIENGIAALILLPFAGYYIAIGEGPSTLSSWLLVIFGLGVICTAVASIIYLEGFRRIRADHVAVLSYTEPISAIVFTALLPWVSTFIPALATAVPDKPEPFGLMTILGAGLVVAAGVYIMMMERSEPDDGIPEIVSMELPDEFGDVEPVVPTCERSPVSLPTLDQHVANTHETPKK